MTLLEIKGLDFYYPECEVPALKNVFLKIKSGDFFVMFGKSGCGKTTLLRSIKPALAPHGQKRGEILFDGVELQSMSERDAASRIGFVGQSPDNMIVTDKVWHELAFGLESLGFDTPTIRRRVAEMASFFGIENWFEKKTDELSGGQKQILNLASVMVMKPDLIILDEPTSQLDPIAASDFFAVLQRINKELGTTVLISEHRLEEALSLASGAAYMENAAIAASGSVREVADYLRNNAGDMYAAMPAAMRIWSATGGAGECPVSVNEGRRYIEGLVSDRVEAECKKADELTSSMYAKTIGIKDKKKIQSAEQETLSGGIYAKDVSFSYKRGGRPAVRNVSFEAHPGEINCILGGNGTGKTTFLKMLAGILKPDDGVISTGKKVVYLPQNPQLMFNKKTVREQLDGCPKELISEFELERLADKHPYDLSGGEQQRLALAEVFASTGDVFLLDEPTKGLDAGFKPLFANLLKRFTDKIIIIVSHDVDFCASYADRCHLFFNGEIAVSSAPAEFFRDNNFYTTAAVRMTRGLIENVITTKDVTEAFGCKEAVCCGTYRAGNGISSVNSEVRSGNGISLVNSEVHSGDDENGRVETKTDKAETKTRRAAEILRKIAVFICIAAVLGLFFYASKLTDISEIAAENAIEKDITKQAVYVGILALMFVLIILTAKRSKGRMQHFEDKKIGKRKLPKRTIAAVASIMVLIPATLWAGLHFFEGRQYYITALAILIESMLPFFMIFEGRKPKAREIVLIAVLSALGVAGRAAFFMLPQFKPVLALTVIAGVAFGGESGFLVGSLTMLASNVMFSQGPWTPWQMFAMGIIGFSAGVLYRKGVLARSRASLSVFGAICALVIYGGIMNPASALMWGQEGLNFKVVLSYYVSGFPMDCVHAASTAIFLWFLSGPMLEKLDRIKEKYGLEE